MDNAGRDKNYQTSLLGVSSLDSSIVLPLLINPITGRLLVEIMGGGGGGGHIIEDEGIPLPNRSKLNFIGAGVTAADNLLNDSTDVTILGGGDVVANGIAGGQTIAGDTLANGNLTLKGTSNATHTNSRIKLLDQLQFLGSAIIRDANDKIMLLFSTAGSLAVNYLSILNSIAGTGPSIVASGSDTDIDIDLTPKGAGNVKINGNIVNPTLYEVLTNKATGFGTINDTLYPTVKAVNDAISSAIATGTVSKPSAHSATTAPLPTNTYNNGASGVGATLTGVATGVLTIDGHAVVLNDYVLVKDETLGQYNGLYLCTVAGAVGVAYVLTRDTSMDTSTEFSNSLIVVENGTANAGTLWLCSNNGSVTVGTTPITFINIPTASPMTTATLGALIGSAGDATPNDTDYVATSLTAGGILKKITWTNVKAFLKTYFDTVYTLTNLGGVPTSRTLTINGVAFDLSANRTWVITKQRRLLFPVAGVPTSGLTNTSVTRTLDGTYTISQCNMWYDTAGNGTVPVDILLNGTTIFATTKPSITSTNASSINTGTITTTSGASGDRLTLNTGTVSGTAGTGLYVELILI